MNEINEKIAYLAGLKDGMNIQDQNMLKLIDAVTDALKAISEHIEESDDYVDEIAENVDLMGDELDEIEDMLDDIYCDDDDCCDCDKDDCCDCDDDSCCCDDDCLELECPHCKETVCFDSDLFVSGEELRCPVCNKVIFEEER